MFLHCLTFCLLIMFIIEVLYTDYNIKNLLANHCFNHKNKFCLSFIIVIELMFAKKTHVNENIFAGLVQTFCLHFDFCSKESYATFRQKYFIFI